MLPDPGCPGRAVSRGGTSPERRYAAARAPGESRTRRGRPARARPRRRGSPDPIPNSAAKPAIAQSTAEPVRGRTGRRARAGRVRPHRGQGARRGGAGRPLPPFQGASRPPFLFYVESQPAQAFCMLEDWISRLLTLLVPGHHFLFTDCLTIYSRRLALCRDVFLYRAVLVCKFAR